MSVILLILKIIGILLLTVLGLFLLAVCLALFIPVCYTASGALQGTLEIHIKISWLLHLVVWRSDYIDGEYSDVLKILGIGRRGRRMARSAPDAEEAKMDGNMQDDTGDVECGVKKISEAASGTEESAKADAGSGDTVDAGSRHTGILRRFKQFFTDTKRRILALKKQLFDIKSILVDETNKTAVVSILTELKYLLGHFRFRAMDADLQFSMGDPAMTGQALGALSVMPFLYRYRVHVHPDFESEDAYVRGDFKICGRAHGIHVLSSFIRLWRKAEFRDLLRRSRGR